MNTLTEENYLKAIFKLSGDEADTVFTGAIASRVETSSASVTDMLQKLSEKKLISYKKYKGVTMTAAGKKAALAVIRKHRLWEMFLVEKLQFGWDEVHAIAEQLEHIQSDKLIERLDEFLGHPQTDPHGDLIPDSSGKFPERKSVLLSSLAKGDSATIAGVIDHHPSFFRHLEKIGFNVGVSLKVEDVEEYDQSFSVNLRNKKSLIHISHDIAKNLLVVIK
ncbi:MAG: metal-dependent transcriptional regulator [Bacteroidia bacterium]|nr:metal-dependent transcriptional regulator [Bacteroidia bacterium]